MRSIRTSRRYDHVVGMLCLQEGAIFPTRRDLYVFAAFLGYSRGVASPPSDPFHELDGRVFDEKDTMDAILSLALAHEGKKEVLGGTDKHQEEVAQLFEMHIEGGFETLDMWLREVPSDNRGETALITGLRKDGLLRTASDEPDMDELRF